MYRNPPGLCEHKDVHVRAANDLARKLNHSIHSSWHRMASCVCVRLFRMAQLVQQRMRTLMYWMLSPTWQVSASTDDFSLAMLADVSHAIGERGQRPPAHYPGSVNARALGIIRARILWSSVNGRRLDFAHRHC